MSDKQISTRRVAPFFTSGFRGLQSGNILIVDFITAFPGEGQHVFSSVALTKDVAENLISLLTDYIEEKVDGEE